MHDTFWKVEQALARIAGVYPAFVRPPFGSFNDLVVEVAGARGQTVAIWDLEYVLHPIVYDGILTEALPIVPEIPSVPLRKQARRSTPTQLRSILIPSWP